MHRRPGRVVITQHPDIPKRQGERENRSGKLKAVKAIARFRQSAWDIIIACKPYDMRGRSTQYKCRQDRRAQVEYRPFVEELKTAGTGMQGG